MLSVYGRFGAASVLSKRATDKEKTATDLISWHDCHYFTEFVSPLETAFIKAQFTLLKIAKHVWVLSKNLFHLSNGNKEPRMIKATVWSLIVIWHSTSREKRIPNKNETLPQRDLSTNMKPFTVAVLFALVFALGVNSASVSLSSSQLTLNGNAHIQFYGPREAIWAGLSNGKNWNHI